MGIQKKTPDARFQHKVHGAYTEMLNDTEDEMREIGQDAANEAKHYIEDRGVSGTVPNSNGRIDTGDMYNDMDYEVRRRGDVIKLRIGWLPGHKKDYYSHQEFGTLDKGQPAGQPKPEGPPRGIRPMLALTDASLHAAEELNRRFGGRRRG